MYSTREEKVYIDYYSNPGRRKRDFILGSIGVLGVQVLAIIILARRWDLLPPVCLLALVCSVFGSLLTFFGTLRKHQHLEHQFDNMRIEENKELMTLLVAARVDLKNLQSVYAFSQIIIHVGLGALAGRLAESASK